MNKPSSPLPDFKKPPVVEVVCGMLFKPILDLIAPHTGLFWETLRTEFPDFREMPPLVPVIENLDPNLPTSVEIAIPPMPRIWFLDDKAGRLVQLQRDRFHFNWRRVNADDPYPRFSAVFAQFVKYLDNFKTFLLSHGMAPVLPVQYELTYVNLMDGSLIDDKPQNFGKLFRDLAWDADMTRWLSSPEDINWQASFALPNGLGRLHAIVRVTSTFPMRRPTVRLDLIARGISPGTSPEEMTNWFETGHEWIVRGFADLTVPGIQKDVWERING